MRLYHRSLVWALVVLCSLTSRAGAWVMELHVVGVSPAARIINAPINSKIDITFDQPLNPATINSQKFWAFGRWSGPAVGTLTLSNGNQTATLTPTHLFSAGEQVMVILSHDIQSATGDSLRSAGYSYQFWIKTRPALLSFTQVQLLSTRTTPGQQTHAYGGFAADLNGDRFLDIGIVNEISADLRVFINHADQTGTFNNFLQPPSPLAPLASPSEPTDFNRDGKVDVCTANTNANSVSILLGNGNGTFGPQQQIMVGSNPNGITVLDVDGDGDIDIVNSNTTSGNLSVLLNNGSGVFGPATFFNGGVGGERGITTADMNEDGILDLVVAGWTSHEVSVLLGNGNGTFTLSDVKRSGGETRVVVCGDVNADGHEDVAASNGNNNNASILLGNGLGTLGLPTIYPTSPFTGPSDLGDLDGDGDLDWVIASFQGTWRIMLNNGSGVFTFNQEFTPANAASCSLLMDIDNDRDLDLALIDEIADTVKIMKNSGTAPTGDVNNDGITNVDDLLAVINSWGPCPPPGPGTCPADIAPPGPPPGNGIVNIDDLLTVINNWS